MTGKPNPPLFEAQSLSVGFEGSVGNRQVMIHGIDFSIRSGEIVAIIGESGSGKSLLAQAFIGLLPSNGYWGGRMLFKGRKIQSAEQQRLRGKSIFLLPQSVEALDPFMKVGKQIQSVLKKGNKMQVTLELLDKVGLPRKTYSLHPFELSGGMARKVLGAMALAIEADLVIADEPTPGLDEESLHTVVSLLKQLSVEGKGIVLITHDIRMAVQIADRIAVCKAGRIVEVADVKYFSGRGDRLRHPYTKALWRALPENSFSL
ncbi:ABC transporter ATP-binding protein [Sporosarcina sp. BI001-red]|uniref:ATP-binding cassette domain-containing protein n=1 Tax=Sporosarcina sp. BI001-red TaxID=2282866 RepID=UPI000E22BBC7|nr:ABC transporter ATP-binding protein [Sporosarcina sp. BI001-red]REB04802.1 ABC transporter ATP-binding protein [Sporosarcina sp. BI001-red]